MIDATYTPVEMIESLGPVIGPLFKNKKELFILEPAAGDGRILNYLYEAFCMKDLYMTAVEEDSFNYLSYIENHSGFDFLTWRCSRKFDLIITNPPWSLFDEYHAKCERLLHSDGYLILMMKIDIFQSGVKRYDRLFKRWMPQKVVMYNKPGKFYTNKPEKQGEVNLREKPAWMIWKKGENGFRSSGESQLSIIDLREWET